MANTNSQLAVKKFFTVEELNMLLLLVNDVFPESTLHQFQVTKQLRLNLHFLSKDCGPQQQ